MLALEKRFDCWLQQLIVEAADHPEFRVAAFEAVAGCDTLTVSLLHAVAAAAAAAADAAAAAAAAVAAVCSAAGSTVAAGPLAGSRHPPGRDSLVVAEAGAAAAAALGVVGSIAGHEVATAGDSDVTVLIVPTAFVVGSGRVGVASDVGGAETDKDAADSPKTKVSEFQLAVARVERMLALV